MGILTGNVGITDLRCKDDGIPTETSIDQVKKKNIKKVEQPDNLFLSRNE